MSDLNINGPAPRNPARLMRPVFVAAAMVAVCWLCIAFGAPSGVTITAVTFTAILIGGLTAVDAMERAERRAFEGKAQ